MKLRSPLLFFVFILIWTIQLQSHAQADTNNASFTEAEIYTEPHNAAAAAVGTTNFFVGRLALECSTTLTQDEAWVKEFAAKWQKRNNKYYRAATVYVANVMSYYERKYGAKAKDMAIAEYISSVRNNGMGSVEDVLPKENRKEKCTQAIAQIETGEFDITPAYPFYKELNELVDIIQKFEDHSLSSTLTTDR